MAFFLAPAVPYIVGGAVTFIATQLDGAIEVVTGEKDGINPVTLAIIVAGLGYFYVKVIKE